MSSAAAILSLCATGAHENMNTGGAYLIAKSDGTPNQDWNTSFTLRKNAEYFDVYAGPISTRYGEVFWEGACIRFGARVCVC